MIDQTLINPICIVAVLPFPVLLPGSLPVHFINWAFISRFGFYHLLLATLVDFLHTSSDTRRRPSYKHSGLSTVYMQVSNKASQHRVYHLPACDSVSLDPCSQCESKASQLPQLPNLTTVSSLTFETTLIIIRLSFTHTFQINPPICSCKSSQAPSTPTDMSST